MAQDPKPKRLAIVGADAEFQRKATDSARNHGKAAGLEIVYDRAYPPNTVDFSPIVRSVQAARPDLVYLASYPSDTVGFLRAVQELGLDTKMLGGGLAGLAAAAVKQQLGAAANGVVNIELWEPVQPMQFPGVMDFIKKYQERAPAEGVDPLGYFLPPFAYAELQILGQAVEATKTLNDDKLADYIHKTDVQHDRRRHRVRPGRRMDRGAADLGAVSRHQGQRHRAVPRAENRLDPLPAAIQNRRLDLALHKGARGVAARCISGLRRRARDRWAADPQGGDKMASRCGNFAKRCDRPAQHDDDAAKAAEEVEQYVRPNR